MYWLQNSSNIANYIEVKENVKPVVTPVSKVPHLWKPKLEKELKKVVALDFIEPIKKPTDWVNGLVIAEKPNRKLRICLDPSPLNNAIKHEHLHSFYYQGNLFRKCLVFALSQN